MEELQMKKGKLKCNKGITLIALIITIALNRCRGGHI